ncbi:TPA: ash family protein [Serratia marcescens]
MVIGNACTVAGVVVIIPLHLIKRVPGVRTRLRSKATIDAYRVFFIVVKSVHLYSAAQIRTESMVALAGQPSGWPVPFDAGILTPVSVTTI